MKKISNIFFGIFLTLIFSPSQGLSQNAEPKAKQLNEVVLQLKWYHQFQFAGYYAADIKGFYADEGIQVKMIQGAPNKKPTDAVLSGIADLGIFDTELIVNFAEGDPVVALDAFFQSTPVAFAFKESSGIPTLAKLSQSVIMIDSLIGLTELKATLTREGINSNSLNVFDGPYSFDEFVRNDSIDAIHAYYTVDIPKMQQDGLKLDVLFPSMYGVDFYGDILFTSTRFLKQSPDVVRRFRQATKKGWEYARNNQEEIINYISELPGVQQRGMTVDALTTEANRTWDISIPEVVPYGYMNPDRWEKIASYYAEAGLVPEDLNIDDFLVTPEQTLFERLLPTLKYIILGLFFIAICIGLWLYMLKKEVKRRTNLWLEEFREKQKTTKKLEQKKRDFKTLIENIRECVFAMTPDGVFTYVSPNVEKITGYTKEEVVGIKYAPFFPKKILPVLFDRLKTRIETDVDDNATIEIMHKNGSTRWVSASTKVFTDPEHGTFVQGTFNDNTERIRTQRALKYSEERFRKLTENSPVGIYILSGDEYIYTNKKYAAIFDGVPEELIGEKIDPTFIHEEDRDQLFRNIKKLSLGELEVSDHMYRAYTKDGSMVYIHFYSTIIEVEGERLLFGTALDVTERMKVQVALQEQEERFRMLTEKSFTGLVLIQDNEVLYINPRYLEILGFDRGEITTSEDLFKLTHPDDIGSIRKSVEDREKGIIDHVHYQCRMYHKAGHIVYVDIYGSVVTINEKKAMMASVMDISDTIKDKSRLEKSINEKNILLAEIHHRVKNNMAVVSGLMELQKFKTEDKVAQSLLRESQLRIKTIAMIHEKLYQSESFSEIPFGKYLSELISTISDSLYQESSNIIVEENYDELSLNINQAIPAALFVNEVVTNCFKHAFPDNQKGVVRISVKKTSDNKIHISISDNGKGLPKDFEQSDSLGITLIKNLSNQIDAELLIKNGAGSCFEIAFPLENTSGSAAGDLSSI